MAEFLHVTTRTNGPDTHMAGLGDVIVHEENSQVRLYTAGGSGGGVLVRRPDAGLNHIDREDYQMGQGLAAPRQLLVTDIDGTPTLLAPGRYGDQIEAWTIKADGTLGAAAPLKMVGGVPGSTTALVEMTAGGQHVFVTASRHDAGLEVWVRDGTTLHATDMADTSGFLQAGAVNALALATPGGVPFVLAIDAIEHTVVAFQVLPGGALGLPTRLDQRDGLAIDTPTELETVVLAGQTYAIVGAAGSSSVSVIAIDGTGQMRVTSQVNDTLDTRFDNLVALDTLEAAGTVFVLAGGSDNGLSLMTLQPGGRLAHVASLGDEAREMALKGIGGLDMVWRDGGLDIFVTGHVLPGTSTAGTGVTQLRLNDVASLLPTVQFPDASLVQYGTSGADVFVLADTDDRQEVRGFEKDVDRLDVSAFARVYSVDDLQIRSRPDGAEITVGSAFVQVFTADGSSLEVSDFSVSNTQDLWQIDVGSIPQAPSAIEGTDGPDLLDGREGDDMLLGQPKDMDFDPYSAQVFRLYQATLDRAPDINGLLNWTDVLQSGSRSLVDVAAGFTNSLEFNQTYGATDDQAFVTLLYNNVLDRDPDAQGLANWTARLDAGTSRAEVVIGFSESAEFKTSTEAEALRVSQAGLQAEFGDDIYRLYRATLDREPDLNGFLNWSDRLADNMPFLTVVSGFTNSPEFNQTYGATDDQAFVTLLYNNVLDRDPDAQGLANWTARLAQGEMSRAQVVQGFSQSSEFRAGTKEDLKSWVMAQGADDVLDGAGGENLLMGGVLSDTFVFRAADNSQHVVVDLEPWDVLRLQGFGYDDPGDVARHLRAEERDVIFVDDGVTIEFLNTTVSQILDMTFEF
ncbi:MAG: DUF4214 domain-containing protein [Pseudomonadota bacterium]